MGRLEGQPISFSSKERHAGKGMHWFHWVNCRGWVGFGGIIRPCSLAGPISYVVSNAR